jgi:hypothetical protein
MTVFFPTYPLSRAAILLTYKHLRVFAMCNKTWLRLLIGRRALCKRHHRVEVTGRSCDRPPPLFALDYNVARAYGGAGQTRYFALSVRLKHRLLYSNKHVSLERLRNDEYEGARLSILNAGLRQAPEESMSIFYGTKLVDTLQQLLESVFNILPTTGSFLIPSACSSCAVLRRRLNLPQNFEIFCS